MGRSDLPLTVYARAVKRRDRLSEAHLKAFDRTLEWAAMGSPVAQLDRAPAF